MTIHLRAPEQRWFRTTQKESINVFRVTEWSAVGLSSSGVLNYNNKIESLSSAKPDPKSFSYWDVVFGSLSFLFIIIIYTRPIIILINYFTDSCPVICTEKSADATRNDICLLSRAVNGCELLKTFETGQKNSLIGFSKQVQEWY